MLNVLFAAQHDMWDDYVRPLNDAFLHAGLQVNLAMDHTPESVDYIIYAPTGPIRDFAPYTRAKAVMNLWAGVETIVGDKTLTQPLCRMVDDSLTRGMVEWVTGHTLRHHLGMDAHLGGQDGIWRNDIYPPVAPNRPVTILGLGKLGAACGQALYQLGFPVTGWSRSAKDVPHIRCLKGGAGLRQALTGAQIVVLLLPHTPQTENILSTKTLAYLAPDACIINPGRGPLIHDKALLDALESGQVGHATLDVFRTEPLPPEHPFWMHPKVTVTPHIASTTRPETSSVVIAENIARGEMGQSFLHQVDRGLGY